MSAARTGLPFGHSRKPLEGEPIWEAAQGARFFIHTYLLGANDENDPTGEGREIASEVLSDLQKAFEFKYAEHTPPICSGCFPIKPFECANPECVGGIDLHVNEPCQECRKAARL